MTDHKYTDEEVIRACECCASSELGCIDCPAGDTPLCGMADKLLLEIVQRQRAEIERLTVELDAMRGAANSYKMHYDNAKAKGVKELTSSLLGYVEGCKITAEKRHKARGNGASRDYTVGKMYAYGKVVEFLRKYEVNDESIQKTQDT